MADDGDRRSARPQLVGGETPTEQRRQAEHRERVVEQQRGENALRNVSPREVTVAEIEGGGCRERSRAAEFFVIERRHRLDERRLVRHPRK